MDASALAIAQRHDPYTIAGDDQRDRQATLFAARLERRAAQKKPGQGLLQKASLVAARPFHLDGALDASRDLECLTQAVYYEARGETPAGQAAVAQVVLNRVRHPAFPKSICGVVYQGASVGRGCQFSFACDGSTRKRREPGAWARAERVASRALSGGVMETVGNATHFHTTNVSPGWGPRLVRVSQIGMHVFYKFGGRNGAPGSFDRAPERSGPQVGDRPMFAGLSPEAPIPYTSLREPKEAVFIAATAVAPAPMKVEPSMAAATGKPAEPAAHPATARPAPAKPAAAKPHKPEGGEVVATAGSSAAVS